jgi:hypothetical protein
VRPGTGLRRRIPPLIFRENWVSNCTNLCP